MYNDQAIQLNYLIRWQLNCKFYLIFTKYILLFSYEYLFWFVLVLGNGNLTYHIKHKVRNNWTYSLLNYDCYYEKNLTRHINNYLILLIRSYHQNSLWIQLKCILRIKIKPVNYEKLVLISQDMFNLLIKK